MELNIMMNYILVSFIWWQFLSIVVVSAGLHRYFSHRAFKVGVWYEYLVLILAPITGSGPVLGWVGVHRLHHRHSDTKLDPHSPEHVSRWRVLSSTFSIPSIRPVLIKDLLHNPRVKFFYKHHTKIRIISALSCALILPPIWFLVFFVSPIIYGYLGFGIINTFCHKDGKPINSHLANIFSGGEGFHKNHHEEPSNWRVGRKWYEIDPAAYFIRGIMK